MSPSVVVVGGGVSGLSAAHRLLELRPNLSVTLLEASERFGGLIRSERIGESLIEHGPDSVLTEKPAALELAKRLDLNTEILPTNTAKRGAYVVYRGRLERIPDGFSMMAPARVGPVLRTPILSPLGKLRMLSEVLLPRGPGHDESVGSFVSRRFGKQVLERLAQPLMGGIYGTDVSLLSLQATMPRFPELEASHRSVTLGLLQKRRNARGAPTRDEAQGARYGLFVSFRDGMQTLTDALAKRLGAIAQSRSQVTTIRHNRDGRYEIGLGDRAPITADAVVLAIAARPMAAMLNELDTELSQRLLDIQYGSTATAYYSFRRSDVAHALDAFGFVVPSRERRAIIASTWASVKFEHRAPKDQALLRVFFGGDSGEEVLELSDERLAELGLEELRELVGVTGKPFFFRVSRQHRAMPKYLVGHTDRVRRIEQRVHDLPRLQLAGNSMYGVGIPDAIRSGERAAERVIAELSES